MEHIHQPETRAKEAITDHSKMNHSTMPMDTIHQWVWKDIIMQ